MLGSDKLQYQTYLSNSDYFKKDYFKKDLSRFVGEIVVGEARIAP